MWFKILPNTVMLHNIVSQARKRAVLAQLEKQMEVTYYASAAYFPLPILFENLLMEQENLLFMDVGGEILERHWGLCL